MPVFSTILTVNQTVTSADYNIVEFDTVQHDSNNFWDAGNYSYTPQIAGFYQFNGQVYGLASNEDMLIGSLFKNGADTLIRTDIRLVPGGTDLSLAIVNFSGLFYMNGTTDYMQVAIYVNGTSTQAGAYYTMFQGFLVRPD
jgi:hypothetical protein